MERNQRLSSELSTLHTRYETACAELSVSQTANMSITVARDAAVNEAAALRADCARLRDDLRGLHRRMLERDADAELQTQRLLTHSENDRSAMDTSLRAAESLVETGKQEIQVCALDYIVSFFLLRINIDCTDGVRCIGGDA